MQNFDFYYFFGSFANKPISDRNDLAMETRGQFHQRVYVQLLRAQIPKAQKLLELTVFFAHFGSMRVKAVRKMLMKSRRDRETWSGVVSFWVVLKQGSYI